MSHLSIAIAGCGPAGLAAALLLHRHGHDVTLFERFDEPRPIGSGLMLQPSGLAVLDALDLAPQIIAHSAPIRALHGLSQHGDIALDARYADLGVGGACGLGIHRGSLFAILYCAVQAAGIAIETGFPIARSDLTDNGRTLVSTAGATTGPFDLVVDALGTSSPLAPPCGDWLAFGALWATLRWPDDAPFDPGLLTQRYRHAHEMAGVLPTGRRVDGEHRELAFFWSLKADDYPAWQAAGLGAWKEQVLALWPECACLLEQITDPAQLTFARYAHRQVPAPVQPRLIHIGDAWHSASPQLGQGANMALLDAYGLAKGLDSDGPLQGRLEHSANLRSGHVKLYQALTWAATPLYQSERVWHALLRDLILTPAGRIPPAPRIQARLVCGLVGDPLGRLGLAMADYAALLAPTQR
ncbi:FAD-dependent monooxygenase [Erythrobacter sp. SDW2]|uniref:FAD-dependent oxidoreductase n=1 Tax=Erythrobacter sp. SDW2 TaxID=2907154 RepID=UPI001F2544B9|nr:NAD(P)/FAD-dependent oxidoreductase [Erythrobacter sp. SDW2]UIP06434.1 FAD-dependent monooxygenase [Erythrobacter sp. SDW2]